MRDRDLAALYQAWAYAGGWVSLRDGVLKVDYEDVHEQVHKNAITGVTVRGYPCKLTILCVGQIIELPWFNKKSALEIRAALGF